MPVMPSNNEQEYFNRMETERRKKMEAERSHAVAAEERRRLKDLHHMHCPKCGMNLIEIDYKGLKIDECSECKGIWFDDKELDALLAIEKPILKKLVGIFRS